jgi:hypothetical protein
MRPVFFKNDPNRDCFFVFVFCLVVTTEALRLAVSEPLWSPNRGSGFKVGNGSNRGSGFNPGNAGGVVLRFVFSVRRLSDARRVSRFEPGGSSLFEPADAPTCLSNDSEFTGGAIGVSIELVGFWLLVCLKRGET